MTKLRSVACARIAAVSTISTMKVERPRARLSDAPTRLNSRSTRPSVARRRGHEAARLREHRDQRVLAQEGRLAAHVGAGDQPQPRVLGQPAIVGDEALARRRDRRFDHRMAAALDLETGMRRRCRAGTSRPRPRARRAPAATSSRASASAVAAIGSRAAERGVDQLLEMRLPRRRARGAPACATFDRLLVQRGRVEADDAGERLAVGEAAVGAPSADRRRLRRHLDMIAEHAVVADLERRRCRSASR